MLLDLNKLRQENGVALIAVLGIVLALSVLTIALAYRAGLFIAESRGIYVKDQDLYSAETGLEEMRYYLWEQGCVPPNWVCGGLTSLSMEYTNVTNTVLGLFNQDLTFNAGVYRIAFKSNGSIVFQDASGSKDIDNYTYTIFARTTNIPKTLNILVSGERPGQQGTTTIESAFIFSVPCQDDYKQFGQCSSKEGRSGESLSSQQVRTAF